MGKKVIIVYKGMTGEAERSPKDNAYHGVIVDISQEVSFEGATISELQLSFTRAVDAYKGDSSRPALGMGAAAKADMSAEVSQSAV
jgi:predicted HicB family RNase H-like nuclease